MPTRPQRFKGSLMGVRIGDALGMPFETLTPEQIAQITGPQGVTTFWDPQPHRTDPPDSAWMPGALLIGDYTDDTQLTFAGARSLILSTYLDLDDLAHAYIDEMDRRILGWGGTTTHGLREIQRWYETAGRQGRSPLQFAGFPRDAEPGYGCGNGVAMRIAPMALLVSRGFDHEGRAIPGGISVFQQMIWNVGGLTHPDPRASIGAYAVAAFIARLAARHGELTTREELLSWFTQVLEEVIIMEVTLGDRIRMPVGIETVSSRLDRVLDLFKTGASAQDMRKRLGTSSYALESVPFSLAMFFQYPTDFRTALKETVEAGGDTDTNAAIVGSLVGANVGIIGIPPDWRNFRPNFVNAEDLGAMLYALSEEIHLAAGSAS